MRDARQDDLLHVAEDGVEGFAAQGRGRRKLGADLPGLTWAITGYCST